jgi:hypothetical protein
MWTVRRLALVLTQLVLTQHRAGSPRRARAGLAECAIKVERGADQGQMGERLGEVA